MGTLLLIIPDGIGLLLINILRKDFICNLLIQNKPKKKIAMRIFMKLNLVVLFAALVGIVMPGVAQEKTTEEAAVYRRSSLHTMLIETGDFMKKDLVIGSYNLAPFPDKYNDHRLEINTFDATPFMLTKEQKAEAKEADKAEKDAAKDNGEKELPLAIEKYFIQNKVANKLVAKWFNRQEDGTFDMSMIHERGSYDATEMEAQIAKGSIRGLASLKDAGEELISNTFVVLNSMNFVENEPIAYAIKESALILANRLPSLAQTAAKAAAEAAYVATKDGYSVWAVSYLFQLEWNDEIANEFYMEMWMDKSNVDSAIKERFDTTSIFKLNYIGFEKAKSLVLIGVGKSEQQIIQQATIRNVDKVYTKLQKTYDVFKTKTPIYSVDPVVAKIGLKEGIEKNDKYEVLEMVVDKKTGLTKYAVVGTVKVKNANIWDNRYYMGEGEAADMEEPADGEVVAVPDEEEVTGNRDLDGTHFKGGGKKVMTGMLLRQVK
jgi:hypothetical protein